MKSIDISGPNGVMSRATNAAVPPVRGTEPVGRARLDTSETKGPALSLATAGDSPPIDSDRIAEIRKAIEQDRYPIVPARIADAMIAAGLMLRMK